MGLIKLLFSKREREYAEYAARRDRSRQKKARYDAERGIKPPETFQASVRLADGTIWSCDHAHRTRSAAQQCGEQRARQ